MTLFKQEFDPEVQLWVAQRAQEIGEEIRDTPFRKGMLKRRRKPITIYDQHGRPIAKIKIQDTGSTEHEFDNHQDAVARPLPITPKPRMDRKLWTPMKRNR